ncbi:hypothetical protein [Evansella halocellulosilytica]|uniref:hypothetical protein n=1 Tax=Evansella halocellulosilytica TaxID=2011013 RepID=UPI000BB6B62F|nr:hypothetical protein [Evansella halocellulosilytica]
MKNEKATFLVDFQKMKEKKQSDAENTLLDLYESLFQYIEKEANLREKVRAKHIFAHKVGIPKGEPMASDIHMHFEHWFAFDYITVVGSRMFDLFIRDKKETMSKKMLELSSFLLLMTFEPVRLQETEKNYVNYKSIITKENKQATPFIFPIEGKYDDIVLIRTVQTGFKQMMIGPTIPLNDHGAALITKKLENHQNSVIHKRKYLKEYGIDYLR